MEITLGLKRNENVNKIKEAGNKTGKVPRDFIRLDKLKTRICGRK
jgi:hypothetical protein